MAKSVRSTRPRLEASRLCLVARRSTVPQASHPPDDPQVTLERWQQLATLEDALRTLLGTPRQGGRRHRCMWLAWMRSRDRSHPLTFERVCEAFAMDTFRLRARVLSL